MATTSLRIFGFPLCPSLCSPKLDHHSRISFLRPLNSRQARSVSVVKSNFPNYYRTKAAVKGSSETVVVPTSVPVRVAHELLLAGHRYLDVRTPEEFYAGHAPGAINIPYMYRVGSGLEVDGIGISYQTEAITPKDGDTGKAAKTKDGYFLKAKYTLSRYHRLVEALFFQ